MNTAEVLFNDKVNFRLDGNQAHEGSGIVKSIHNHEIKVELTKPCKEFDVGAMILIDKNELI